MWWSGRELRGGGGVSDNLPQVQTSILVCLWMGMSLVLKSAIVPLINYYKSQGRLLFKGFKASESQPMDSLSNREEENGQESGIGLWGCPKALSGAMMPRVTFGCLCETLKSRLGLPTDSLWNLKCRVHGGLLLRPPTCIMTPQKKYERSAWEKPRNVPWTKCVGTGLEILSLERWRPKLYSGILPKKERRKEKER